MDIRSWVFDNLNMALQAEERQSQRFDEVIVVYDEKTKTWTVMACNK